MARESERDFPSPEPDHPCCRPDHYLPEQKPRRDPVGSSLLPERLLGGSAQGEAGWSPPLPTSLVDVKTTQAGTGRGCVCSRLSHCCVHLAEAPRQPGLERLHGGHRDCCRGGPAGGLGLGRPMQLTGQRGEAFMQSFGGHICFHLF